MSGIRAQSSSGVIRASSMMAMGVASSTIVDRCLPDGPWQRILPGLVLLHNGEPSERQRLVAAMEYAGPGALITGAYGLTLHAQRPTPTPVHLLVPHHTRRRSVSFVVVERTLRMPGRQEIQGLPVADLTRCTIDAARRSKSNSWCLDALTTSLRTGGTSIDELAIELASCTTRGTAVPRRQLKALGRGAASIAEVAAQELYARAGLPPAVANVDVVTLRGEFVARPDLWLDNVAMAWEIDSFAHHLDLADHERTMERRSRMQSAGIVVVSHLPRTVRQNPQLVVAELRAAYAMACQRTRPAVRIGLPTPTEGHLHSVGTTEGALQ